MRKAYCGSAHLSQATGCERLLRKRPPFTSHWVRKAFAEALTFHKPLPCRRQGKGLWLSLTFHLPRLCLRVFGSALPSALPLLRLGCAHGARTARLFARGPHSSQWVCLWRGAFGVRAFGRCHWLCLWRECANDGDPGTAATGKMPVVPIRPASHALRLAKGSCNHSPFPSQCAHLPHPASKYAILFPLEQKLERRRNEHCLPGCRGRPRA